MKSRLGLSRGTHDAKGTYIFASPASTVLLGLTPEELVDTNLFNMVHDEDRRVVMDAHKKLASTDAQVSMRYRLRHGNGDYIWVETYSQVVAGLQADGAEILSVSRRVQGHLKHDLKASLLEDRKRAEERRKLMEQLAHRDDLTSLMSRRAVDELLAVVPPELVLAEIDAADRHGGRSPAPLVAGPSGRGTPAGELTLRR